MARPQNRKRERANEPSRADIDHPAKRAKTRSEIELEAWASWEYPPEFWDRLSKISLSRRALKELDRRTRTRRRHPSPPSVRASPSRRAFSRASRGLARFARHGGPDLRDLRGYPHPPTDRQNPVAMSASRSSRSRRTRSTDPASTLPTSATTKTKKSTPYNRDFELHLTEHLVHPEYSSQEPDLEEVRAAMAVPRPSLSPSKFSDGAFKAFRISNGRAKDEADVLASVIPTITGPNNTAYFTSRNTVFGNLDPLTDETIAAANPDFYDGAEPQGLDRSIRDELAGHIVPSTMLDKPMAPNFFMEVKGPDGSLAVAIRQARYDGAVGACGIHSLQNYREIEPKYDGNAYTYSSIYHGGQLQLYAHHPTAPATEGGRPEYHMTQVKGYAMTSDRETFIQGATAFRNVRDLAKQHRDGVIQAANARAPQLDTAAGQEEHTTTEIQPTEDSADELAPAPFYTTERLHEDSTAELAPPLRQYTTDMQREEDSADELALSPPNYLYEDDDSQDPLGIDPPTSLTTSFRSSFSSYQARPKRARESLTPPRRQSHSVKRRAQPLPQQTIESSTSATGSIQPGPSESHWVETYRRHRKVCFRNPEGKEVKTGLKDWTEQTAADGSQCFYWQSSGRAFWATKLPKEAKKGHRR
ncbi:hypothetical protein B0T17DRAFT_497610 [Bombardia bombarda]|uniref:DUF7924 domain-containing protein n=1 Tax=Bombardia bombarda TaxID=252184 RepID=A0AA39WGV2_9PEZI|nr:hypothetical protein B0T17DRAFT_497610 [Bombardia bombarda]